MNFTDLILILLIAAAVAAAIYYSRKHTSCNGNCGSCHSTCSKTEGGVPAFVKAYRMNHPKQTDAGSKNQDPENSVHTERQ